MSALELLEAARIRIGDSTRWTTQSYSKNRTGKPVDPCTASAVCWDAWGAIRVEAKALSSPFRHSAGERLDRSASEILFELGIPDSGGVVYVNDRLGHAAVLRIFDRAIAKLRSA